MRVRDLYPLITTPNLTAARDFYVTHVGFTVLFEASWCVSLSVEPSWPDLLTEGAGPEAPGVTLAFMHPNHPSHPPGPEPFDGRGMIVTIEVEDAAAAVAALTTGGAPIVHPLTDEPWGQRRFMTKDPAGVLVDVVEQREPAEGYWDQFPPPAR